MAIGKEAILAAVYQGAGQPAKNLIPPTMWSYNNQVQDSPYDPNQARKLLAETGFANGFETDIWRCLCSGRTTRTPGGSPS